MDVSAKTYVPFGMEYFWKIRPSMWQLIDF